MINQEDKGLITMTTNFQMDLKAGKRTYNHTESKDSTIIQMISSTPNSLF